MNERWSRLFFPKLRVHIKDSNNLPHDKFHRFLFPFSSKFPDLNFAPYVLYIRGAPARAKRAWDRAPYSWNMVNLFSFGCHVTDRAYLRTYASTDCTGRVGETIRRKGGCLRPVLASPHLLYMTHNMVNWQLSKQDSHWPVSHDHIAGSRVNSSKFTWFIWKLSADQLIVLLDREQFSIILFS